MNVLDQRRINRRNASLATSFYWAQGASRRENRSPSFKDLKLDCDRLEMAMTAPNFGFSRKIPGEILQAKQGSLGYREQSSLSVVGSEGAHAST